MSNFEQFIKSGPLDYKFNYNSMDRKTIENSIRGLQEIYSVAHSISLPY